MFELAFVVVAAVADRKLREVRANFGQEELSGKDVVSGRTRAIGAFSAAANFILGKDVANLCLRDSQCSFNDLQFTVQYEIYKEMERRAKPFHLVLDSKESITHTYSQCSQALNG